MKNITISAEEIHQSSSKPSHTKQIRQDAGTGGGILIPGPPVGLRGREAEAWHQSPPMVGGTTNGPRYGAATSVGVAVGIAST